MRFFSIAAVFAAGVASVFADDGPSTYNSTVVIPVHVTSIITVLQSALTHETQQNTVTHTHTVHHNGFEHKSVTGLPALRTWSQKPKVHHHSAKKHTHSVKSKHGRRDTQTIIENYTIQPVQVVKDVKTQTSHSTVHHQHTKTVKKHTRPKVTGMAALKAHKKKPAVTPITKEKRGWFF